MKYLTTEELAGRLSLKPQTLKKWRVMGTGPRFVKMGTSVRYSILDIEIWEAKNKRRSTAE